mgnify:CR=1 FL=1
MRNLLEYPVTRAEVLNFLEDLRTAHHPDVTGRVGDTSPILLKHVTAIVEAAFDLRDGIITEKGRIALALARVKGSRS